MPQVWGTHQNKAEGGGGSGYKSAGDVTMDLVPGGANVEELQVETNQQAYG